jgi:diguanylate cyclase (GGDEF)-like protein/PAS domain S-box-containing protein
MRFTPSSIEHALTGAGLRMSGAGGSRRQGPPTDLLERARAFIVGRPSRITALAATLFALIAGSWFLASVWLLAGNGDPTAQLTVADLLPPFLDFGAAAIILLAARNAGTRRATVAWGMVGISMAVYGLGDVLYAWFELGLGEIPFPSLADVAYTVYYPIVVIALLSFPTVAASSRERRRMAIDSAIVVIGGGMVVWQSVFRPALESLDADLVKSLLVLGYPAGDMVLLFGVAAIALRRPAGIDGRALVALVGGLLLVLLADIGFSVASLAVDPSPQRWTDVLYMASTVAMAAAGFFQLRSSSDAASVEAATSIPRPLLYLPYLALIAGYGTLLLSASGSVSDTLLQLLVGASVLTVAILVRQELVLQDNSLLLAAQARRESEARIRRIAGHSSDAIALVNPAGIVADATDAVRRVLGLDAETLIGRSIVSLAHADDVAPLAALIADSAARRPMSGALEWRLWDGDGVWRQVETVAANLIDDPSIGHIVLTTRDVRERKVLEQQLQQVALHDMLTGLANRALFLDRVSRALVTAGRRGHGTVVLTMNLSGFKRTNDGLGHSAGDSLLQEVARRLQANVHADGTCARLGGDDFAVLLGGSATVAEGRAAAAAILAAMHEPFESAKGEVHLTARMGIAVSVAGDDRASTLLQNAGVAMSRARNDGPNGIAVFEPEMQEVLAGRFELEADLRLAVGRNELFVEYQPIMDLVTGELVSAEALVRWNHPTRGRLAPDAFIALAEETGLIDEIGTWVLRTACVEVARWARLSKGRVPRVSVNLSPVQLADPQLPWTIQAAIAQGGAVPAWLALEVTESLLMENTGAVLERLHTIRSLGVTIAIDDFGTGFSSLAYLQQFPMSHIKIDRSFVIPLDDPARHSGVVRAIVEIGRSLGMATIAEGIETAVQLERLRDLGCDLGQGFLLGRPLDAAAIGELIAHPSLPTWALARAA